MRFIAPVNLHQLELFYHVARSGGISRAVRSIPYGIQQPAVSIQMLALEEALGLKLFERQPFRLTAEGRELYDFARPFFDNIEKVEQRLQANRSPSLRIAASELVLRDYLPPVMQQLKQQHPSLRFRLRSGMQADIERWLHDGEIDLAIIPLSARPKGQVKQVSLVQLPLVLLVPESSPVRTASDIWAKDPICETLISLADCEGITLAFQAGLKQLRVDWRTGIEASSTDLVTRYVANGYGIGVTVDVPALVSDPGVRVVPLPGFAPVEIAVLWCPPVRALHDEIREQIVTRARELFPQPETAAKKLRKKKETAKGR